jgi:biotin operon repressor
MLDQLRRDIQQRLDAVLGEVEQLQAALLALGHDEARRPARARNGSTAARSRAASAPRARTSRRRNAGARADRGPGAAGRGSSPGTKSAVLATLAGGSAMTASEVAAATGLGRASVSTTLSKLARSGEVSKAARGYQLTPPPSPARQTANAAPSPKRERAAKPAPARPRPRRAPRQPTDQAAEPQPPRPARAPRARGEELSADRIAGILTERSEGISAVALAKHLGASERRLLALLRELEAAGRARKEGARRTSRWVAISTEQQGAGRASEPAARRAKATTSA